jgi:hypothetical protein
MAPGVVDLVLRFAVMALAFTTLVSFTLLVLAATMHVVTEIHSAVHHALYVHRAQRLGRRDPGDLCRLPSCPGPVIIIHADSDAIWGSSTAVHSVHGTITDEHASTFVRSP